MACCLMAQSPYLNQRWLINKSTNVFCGIYLRANLQVLIMNLFSKLLTHLPGTNEQEIWEQFQFHDCIFFYFSPENTAPLMPHLFGQQMWTLSSVQSLPVSLHGMIWNLKTKKQNMSQPLVKMKDWQKNFQWLFPSFCCICKNQIVIN